MAIREILLLGDKKLYNESVEIKKDELNKAKEILKDLHDTMMEFKSTYGFGRAIAAPQINEFYRIIYFNLGDESISFINPVIEFYDEEKFMVWDDCMSFPGVEVYLERYKRCRVKYRDENFKECIIDFEGDLSELFQHEYDHLNGTLAVLRAKDNTYLRINKSKSGCF